VAGMERENQSHPIDPEKRKWIRFMQAGLSCILAWPVAIMLAAMYGLENIVPDMSVLMVMVGIILMAIGSDGWEQLKERRQAEKQGPPDCPL